MSQSPDSNSNVTITVSIRMSLNPASAKEFSSLFVSARLNGFGIRGGYKLMVAKYGLRIMQMVKVQRFHLVCQL
jgi:hypothetical protein